MLWTWDDLLKASRGIAEGSTPAGITGISIDTRTLAPGDLFVALKDARDGHEFVPHAFARGAAAAMVARGYQRNRGDGALIRVPDPLQALEAIGRAARMRLTQTARVIAVTGSAGKTGTKEMLRLCLSRCGATHAPEKSFNNHWGVPLTLARMPADTRFGVFEIGMNHAGEIAPLTRMARPHVAIVTNVLPVHLGHFPDEEGIADAKAEIFEGLDPTGGGVAVLNRDNRHFARLEAKARFFGARIVTFGCSSDANAHVIAMDLGSGSTSVAVNVDGKRVDYMLEAPGAHIAMNSVAVLAALDACGIDLAAALPGMSEFRAPTGRGASRMLTVPGGTLMLIDESYNANPASMQAALQVLGRTSRTQPGRRIAVLGDMRELGDAAPQLHKDLLDPVCAAEVDMLFACGPLMRGLYELMPTDRRAHWAETSAGLIAPLIAAIRPGDVVMVKGSLGTKMGPIVEALQSHFSRAA
jgi:UDP-N-acetylmuramoyl-tripeptide--D-alanyl-D-alanine ligase